MYCKYLTYFRIMLDKNLSKLKIECKMLQLSGVDGSVVKSFPTNFLFDKNRFKRKAFSKIALNFKLLHFC